MKPDMHRMALRARGSGRVLADFLWPPRSLVSGKRGIGAGPLSPQEFSDITFISGAICNQCGTPQEIDLGPEAICAVCIAHPPPWQRARAAMVYNDGSRRIVLDLKRSGRRDGLAAMTGWMMQAGSALAREADIIVPVPLHYRRLAARGFNQAAWLAAGLARETGTPLAVDAIKRVKATPTQGGLSARGRRRNMSGAFAPRRRCLSRLNGARVLLIDDVLTTGATLGAVARAAKTGGAAHIDALVLARVVRDSDVTI